MNEFRRDEIEGSIPDRFERQVVKFPERIAVKSINETLTYDDLNKMANRVAHAVCEEQGQRNESVAMLIESDAPMIAATIGLLKAGKVCVPIDSSHPRERITYIVKDSEARLILTNNKNLTLANEIAGELPVINVDELDSTLSDKNFGTSYSGDTLAFILYTSGSTGEPKGVIQTHRNLLHMIRRWTNDVGICPDDRLTRVGLLRRDAFRALLNGAAVYPLDLKQRGLTAMSRWLTENGITILHSVPSAFRHWVETLHGTEEFPSLRLIILLGEPLYARDVQLYKRHFSAGCVLVNSLGSTEAHSFSYYLINKQTHITESVVPVGRAVEDTEVLLFSEAGERLGFNQVGEIAVKSPYLSQGYWKKPDLTQVFFTQGSAVKNARLYFTGDLGLMRPDGCLIYVGRKDFQVKIRGNRVEIAEVEAALLDHAGIKEVAVTVWDSRADDRHLVAYFVPSTHPAPTITELRTVLEKKLPAYMIPSRFISLDSLPLTANGKVNRRMLPLPGKLRPPLDSRFVAPRSEIEEILSEIWAEVLDIDQVGIDDNFLDLGGNSLLATQIISRVIQRLHLELPTQSLFEAPTVAAMAAVITQKSIGNTGRENLTRVLDELEALSDAEAQEMTARKSIV